MDSVALSSLIKRLNPRELVGPLHELNDTTAFLQSINVFHVLVEELLNRQTDGDESSEAFARSAAQVVYLLSTHGANVNNQDENGDTALLCYLRAANRVTISNELVVAFLRCGVDSCLKNKDGEDILQYILQRDELPKDIRARVLEYMPGVWCAIDSDDACAVRRLINHWCHVKEVKNGLSALQLAYSKGTENIIRVVSGIGPSMDVAHSVLAGDIAQVKQQLESTHHININLKNMADRGATPLFYAMCNNDWPMTELLLKHGARLDIGMLGENQMELPLYFAALSHRPAIDIDVLKQSIPHKPIPLHQLYYKGRNVIFYCIEYQVDVQLFQEILRKCSACVVTERIENNIGAREYAMLTGRDAYITIIDVVVSDWCTRDDMSLQRNQLCLHGYLYMLPLTFEDSNVNEKMTKYMQLAEEFEDFKMQLREATVMGNALLVKEMLNTQSWSEKGLDVCLADCRVYGDGQPLLHKAVLHGHVDVVTELVQYVKHKSNKKLDTFRDQYFRTALHYVNGMEREDSKVLADILEDSGMSEYSMDKEGRSPLAFKDRRGLQEMKDLIDYHRYQDFSEPEPDPWSVPLPLPITGFLKKCLHEQHGKKKRKHKKDTHGRTDKVQGEISNNQISYDKSKAIAYLPTEQSKQPNENYTYMHDTERGKETAATGICSYNCPAPLQYGIITDGLGNYYHQYPNSEQFYQPVLDSMLDNSHRNSDTMHLMNLKQQNILRYGNISALANENVSYLRKSANEEEVSELSSDDDEVEKDYEGDQSDVESEVEEENHSDKHCSIL